MKHFLVFALALAALAMVPVDIVEPAEACRPYSVYCPLTGQFYTGCGTTGADAPYVQCVRDFRAPP